MMGLAYYVRPFISKSIKAIGSFPRLCYEMKGKWRSLTSIFLWITILSFVSKLKSRSSRLQLREAHMKALRNLITIFILFLLLSVLYVSHVDAQPYWLRRGVYAVYRFEDAYTIKSIGEFGWEFESLGPGVYRWEVIGVEGNIARLNVTLVTKKFSRSLEVTIDTETMDLVEDGRVWGKAWLWIDLAKIPAPPDVDVITRNITFFMEWLNMTNTRTRASRIISVTKEGILSEPVKTGLGGIERVVTVGYQTNMKEFKFIVEGRTARLILPTGNLSRGVIYEAKYGIMVSGYYIDDILTQKFGVVWFKEILKEKRGLGYWMCLEDTNLKLDVAAGEGGILSILKAYYAYILLVALAVLFVVAFLRGRI